MQTNTNSNFGAFRDYLNAFQSKLKWEFGNYIEHRQKVLKEEPEYADEINRQFYEELAIHLAEELANNFNTNPEEVAMFLETFDIQNWLDGK